MEPKFQTSFIPKKQTYPAIGGIGAGFSQKPKVHGASIFMAIAVIIFILSIGAVAGAYFWKSYLTSANVNYKTELASKEKQFDLASIENLKQINVQIDSAKNLLKNHVAMSKIFGIISQLAIEKVRFLNMDVKAPASSGGNYAVGMKGYGTNLPAVAFQSDVLGALEELNLSKIVKNPVLSDPTLDANGTVSFGFSAEIVPSDLLYVTAVDNSGGASSAVMTPAGSTASTTTP